MSPTRSTNGSSTSAKPASSSAASPPNRTSPALRLHAEATSSQSRKALARPGRALRRTGDPAAACAEQQPQPEPIVAPILKLPSNKFHFAGLVKNRSNGFAVLYVRVPGPGKVSLTGRGFRRLSRTARQATTVSLPIKPKVRLRHFLKQHGKGRIRVDGHLHADRRDSSQARKSDRAAAPPRLSGLSARYRRGT